MSKKTVIMKKLLTITYVMLSLLIVVAGCKTEQPNQMPDTSSLSAERTEELHELSIKLTDYLNTSDIDSAMSMMDDAMNSAMQGKLEATWTRLIASAGAFVKTGAYAGMRSGDYEALEMTLVFEKATMIQRVVFASDNQISGLRYLSGEVKGASADNFLPDSITETAVTVDAGEGYPLAGMLTMPAEGTPVAAIVLVHGSGPSDMNATIGANAPFRDLAYSLAENRIAVLRYDKRTYTHGATIAESGASITLDDEVAEDALAAVELIKSWDGINSDNVYLLGHSMGGGLLSYVNSLGADLAGYIIMAGTPRNIWELSAAQNMMLADELEQSGDIENATVIRNMVEQEMLKASELASLSVDQTLFGMPVDYLREFDKIETTRLHQDDGLPVLILHGEQDRQVSMTDYTLWQESLDEHPNATFISYPTLNHLFGAYIGDAVSFSEMLSVEYAQRTPVADDVIKDIARWIVKANG